MDAHGWLSHFFIILATRFTRSKWAVNGWNSVRKGKNSESGMNYTQEIYNLFPFLHSPVRLRLLYTTLFLEHKDFYRRHRKKKFSRFNMNIFLLLWYKRWLFILFITRICKLSSWCVFHSRITLENANKELLFWFLVFIAS